MHKVRYLIVGQGLAGSFFALECLKRGISFLILDDKEKVKTSLVAAGIFNPLILKRFSAIWNAEPFLDQMHKSLRAFERLLKNTYCYPLTIYRRIHDESEVNTWGQKALDLNSVKGYLDPSIIKNPFHFINAPHGLGLVRESGRVEVAKLLKDFECFLINKKLLKKESFSYNHLKLKQKEGKVFYHNIECSFVVFSQGSHLGDNPFFNYLPLIKNKGELLSIEIKQVHLKEIIHAGVFLLPTQQKDVYKVGSTYKLNAPDNISQWAKDEILFKLNKFLTVPFAVKNQEFGMRPTVIDRKPLIGVHPKEKELALINGLGSRGVILAPNMAKILMDHLENGHEIPKELNIARFFHFI